jgi:magnesium-transporting ATPase (P-type)
MVLLASIVDFVQEYMAFKNSSKLIKLISNEVFLVTQKITSRSEINPDLLINGVKKISNLQLTKGDLVYLKAGDLVPTEMKVI